MGWETGHGSILVHHKDRSYLTTYVFMSIRWYQFNSSQLLMKHLYLVSVVCRLGVQQAGPILTHWPLGKFEWNFRYVIFKQILVIGAWGISCEIALIWMSLDFTDAQSTLVQVMAWCRQAASHYLSQCWPRFLSPYGVTRPQWVN